MNRFNLSLLFALALAALVADAREPDGTLGLIRTPNNGMPALVIPGARFTVDLAAQSELQLQGESGSLALQATWSALPGGRLQASVRVPEGAAPGVYALEAKASSASDVMPRAVFVYDAMPGYYVLAHISDTHVGSGRHKRTSQEIITDVFSAVNASEARLAVITGDLTDQGTPEQFVEFLRLLDTLRVPSFVCPGNHDRFSLNYERFFGPLAYSFTFGPDGYLVFDTKDYLVADDIGAQDEELQVMRRALKASRWSIGLTHRYDATMGLRSQFTLFVDDPLDWLLFGHWHRENTDEEAKVPWGATRVSVVPAAINGAMRLIDVLDTKLNIRPFQQVAPVE